MIEVASNSSALIGFSYDPEHKQLRIRFRTGELYLYYGVPEPLVQRLIQARSHGQYFNSTIRGRFAFDRLS